MYWKERQEMEDFYRPYPNEVYRINELLPDNLDEDDIAFFVDTFDYRNRCVNYSFVSPKKRQFKGMFNAKTILDFLTDEKRWTFLCRCLKKYYPNEAEQHIKLFENLKAKNSLGEKDQIEFHYKLVNLYNFFPRRPDMHIDGVLKQIASELANGDAISDRRFKAVYVKTLTKANFPSELEGLINNKDDNRWIGMRFINPAGEPIEAEIGLDRNHGDNCYFDQYNPNEPDGKRLDATEYQDRQKFFDRYLWPLFYDSGFAGDKRFELEKLPHSFLVVPVFSAAIGEKDYGTILGHLYVTFSEDKDKTLERAFLKDDELNKVLLEELKNTTENENKRPSKCEELKQRVSKKKELIELLWKTWAPLAAQAILHGRENDLLAQPVEHGDDILKDFLSKITYMQDWEKVMVFSNHNKTNKQYQWERPEYCFKRYLGGKNKNGGRLPFEKAWDICQPSPKNPTECSACVNDLNSHTNGNNRGFEVDGKCYFRFDLKDVLDEKILPSMDAKDETENSHSILFFQFPAGTFFPVVEGSTKDEAITKLGEYYRNRMLPVFDKLLLKRNVLHHSTKAAVSAIISRNHSHHIGSHVTPRSSVEKISERLETFDSKKTETVNCESKLWKKEREFKFVNLLKNRLDEYIQKKADFTAEIATEPLITTKSLSFVREIFIPLLKNTLFMDGIGANEEVQYRSLTDNRLKVKCFLDSEELDFSIKSGCTKNHTYKYYNYPYNSHCECVNARELKIIEEDFPDKKIALPGPLGEFSFYCFMENFIRNAIKHNRTKLDQNKDSDMEIFVNLEKLDKNHPDRDEFYKIQVWDNMTNPCESRTILINGEEKPVVLKDMIAHLIKQPIVDNDGGLKKGAWGIAEMKVMATLLRGSTDFVNMANNLKVCCHNKDGKERLVYELYVMKAKHTAIVTNNNFDNDTEKNLNKNGIWIFKDLNEFDTHITGGKSPASFKFVLLDLIGIGGNVLSEFLPKFPFRIFTKEFLDENKLKIENSIGSSDEAIEEFKRKIWEVYLQNLFAKKNLLNSQIDLILFLQQAENEFPTNEWEKLKNPAINELRNLNLKVIFKKDKDESVCLNSNLSLMYDRHAGGYRKIKKSHRDNIYFYESFDKSSHDFTSIFLKPESEEMIYELAEAAILRVLVIDERVAERVHEKIKVEEDVLKKFYDPGNSETRRIQIARKAKVYFCTHFSINDDKRPLHNKAEGETPAVEVKMSVSQNDEFSIDSFEVIYGNSESNENGGIFDIVIIHQGVLEEFVKKVLGSYSYEDFLKSLRKHIPHIIVTSGRGIPPNLPKSAKFIPFSLLEDYLLRGGIAKYNLVKIVTELIRRDV
jgi:hypothetical protein